MPIYEYNCQDCGGLTSQLFRTFTSVVTPQCSHCDGSNMGRAVSQVSFVKSWGSSMNWLPSRETLYDVDEDSPSDSEKWLRRLRSEQGAVLDNSLPDTLTKMDAGISPPSFSDSGSSDSTD
jgi:putative FmdB family regulatory protein